MQHSGARDPASRTLFLARLYLSCFRAARPGGVGEPLAGESDRRSIRWPSPLRLYPDRGTGDSPGQSWKAEELRSEEHTSELQSLMRISYAVFCLKKKQNKQLRTKP